jgi:hypothetical protein
MGAVRVLSGPVPHCLHALTGAWLTLAAALLPAQAQAPRLTVIGAGAGVSCAEWATSGRSDPELEQWAFGFASAVAAGVQLQRGDDPFADLDAEAIHTRLGDHCQRRPEDALSVALVRLVLGR